MADIDIGSAAVVGNTNLSGNSILIEEANPANLSGVITSIELWASADLGGCKVATLYKTNSVIFTSRAVYDIGAVTAGSKQTIPVSLIVEAGDYIGLSYTSGTFRRSNGGVGYWYKTASVLPCTDAEFLHLANFALSIYGTGTDVVGWTGGDIGEVPIAGIAKINGVALADILKVNGVA